MNPVNAAGAISEAKPDNAETSLGSAAPSQESNGECRQKPERKTQASQGEAAGIRSAGPADTAHSGKRPGHISQGPPLSNYVTRGCTRCGGSGWIDGKDYDDGSFTTSRPCPSCNTRGYQP